MMTAKRSLFPALSALALCIAASLAPARADDAGASATANAGTWALLVGISKYQNPNITQLRYPASDATAIRDTLTDASLGGIPADHVKLLTDDDANQAGILGAVDSFLKPNVKPGDKVILFLAGHGVTKGVGLDAKGYFLCSDVKGVTTPLLDSSAVSLKVLSDKLSGLPASQFVVFMDACREDPTPGRGVKGNAMTDVLSRGIQIAPEASAAHVSAASFFACSIGQRAFEDASLQHGVFTFWILDGIRKAATPRKPDGAIDMGILASYVKDKVEGWAKETSDKGDYEVAQTPEIVSSALGDPIILMTVSRPYPDSPISAAPPTLTITTQPEDAQILLDGAPIGTGLASQRLDKGGEHQIEAKALGYESAEKTVTARDGYDLVVSIDLKPGGRGIEAATTNQQTLQLYQTAKDAETKSLWEVAAGGYDGAAKADPQFGAAYESLANLQLRRGEVAKAIDALKRMSDALPTAHSYARLSLAYSLFAAKNPSASAADSGEKKPKKKGLFGGLLKSSGDSDSEKKEKTYALSDLAVPKDGDEAAAFALVSAQQAVKLDDSSPEANQALGLALTATDKDGSKKDDALGALGKAAALDAKDAEYPYSLGFAIRRYSEFLKDSVAKSAELARAIASLKEALALRPDYYAAHLELAYCYHLAGDLPSAQKEYETADGYRSQATDGDEVAAINLSLSAIHGEEAQKSGDDQKKKDQSAASSAYLSDAKEISPNLGRALLLLNQIRLGPSIRDFLPSELQKFLPESIEAGIQSKIPVPVNLPRFP